jgi:hypothetical protein
MCHFKVRYLQTPQCLPLLLLVGSLVRSFVAKKKKKQRRPNWLFCGGISVFASSWTKSNADRILIGYPKNDAQS